MDVRISDMSGWCRNDQCAGCDGALRSATGPHWWCICACHPEPPKTSKAGPGFEEAHEVWRQAKAVHEAASVSPAIGPLPADAECLHSWCQPYSACWHPAGAR